MVGQNGPVRKCLRNLGNKVAGVPYNLSDKTMVLYPVPRLSDMIGRGLVRKTGLINVVGL